MISDACAQINCRLSMPLRSSYYPEICSYNYMRFFYKSVEHSLNSGAYYQALNLLTVSEALDALKRCGFNAKYDLVNLSNSTTDLLKTTHFSFFALNPTVVVDCADTPSRISAFANSLSQHQKLLGQCITVIAEQDMLSDEIILEKLSAEGIHASEVVRIHLETARKALKPLAKELSADKTWIILGSRHFAHEMTRVLQGMWAL